MRRLDAAIINLMTILLLTTTAGAQTRGYQQRACGFDMNGNGIVGEPEDCNVCDGSADDGDADGSGADVIYVSCAGDAFANQPPGSDHVGCGSSSAPCLTIGYAFETIADGPSQGREDIVCFRNTCYEENLSPEHSGVAGTRTRPQSGSEARSFELPADPVMLVGWDVDDDGVYPPMDTDHAAVLAPPATCPGQPNQGCAAAPIENPTATNQRFYQKDDERAIFLDNDLSYVELAHFTVRDYGRHTLTYNSGFFDLHDHPNGNKPAQPSEYVYVHDVEAHDLNRDSNYNSRTSAINAFNWDARWIFFENLLFTDNGHWFSRGGGRFFPDDDGYFRWQNVTLTLDACKPPPSLTCDPETDTSCPWGNVCYSETGCEPAANEPCATRTSTSWKMWGYYTGLEVLDSVVDANYLSHADPQPGGQARGIDVGPCVQDWTIRNNEMVDFNKAIEIGPASSDACDGDTDAQGLITNLEARPVQGVVIDRNLIRHPAPIGSLQAGISLEPGGSEFPNQVAGDVEITSNMIASVDGLKVCIAVESGHGWDGSDPAYPVEPVPGTVIVAGNSCYGPIVGPAAITVGDPWGENLSTMQQDIVLRGNLIGGKSALAANVATSYAPSSFDAAGNVYDPDGGFRWNEPTDVRLDLAGYASASDETGSTECVPSLLSTSGFYGNGDPVPVAGDLHLHPTDTCAQNAGSDISAFVAGDYDGELRGQSGGFDAGADEVQPAPLTEPPLRYAGEPEGVLPHGTTSATLRVRTDQDATCSYSETPAVPFGDASRTLLATTGSTLHERALTGLTNDGAYSFSVRCENTAGISNGDDFTVTFQVAGLGTGLVAHWSFDETTGCTAADASGGGHDATLSPACPGDSPSWSAGHLAGALDFDGANDYVEVADHAELSFEGSFSVSAWILPASFGDSKYGRIVAKQKYVGGFGPGYSFYLGDQPSGNPAGRSTLCANLDTGTFGCADDDAVALGVWQHVVLTFDDAGDEVSFYVDGQPVGSFTATNALRAASVPLRIGDRDDLARSFDGKIDDVRLWDRLLTDAEVLELYVETSP